MSVWKVPALLAVWVRGLMWTAAVLLFLVGLFTSAPILWGRIGLLLVGGFAAYLLLTFLATVLNTGD